MYCNNCGKQLPSGSQFCPACGTRAVPMSQTDSGNVRQEYYHRPEMQERLQTLAEGARMREYFGRKTDVYNEYDKLCAMYPRIRSGAVELVLGIICFVIAEFLIMIAATVTIAFLYTYGSRCGVKTLFLVGGIPLIISLAFVLGGVLLMIGNRKRRRATNERRKKVSDRIGELAEELTNHYKAYGPCVVGAEYTNPVILDKLYEYIRSGRAYSYRDAINCMMTDSHRSAVETSARITARAATATAINSGVNAFIDAGWFVSTILR